MNVIAYDPYITDEKLKKMSIDRCETIEDLLKKADCITIHIPKTPESINLIGEKELSMCKKGVKIANVARGGIINEEALYNAIKSGHVSAAALDVVAKEPNFTKMPEEQDFVNPLLEFDNVIYTPHLGASTKEANLNVSIDVAKYVEGVLKGDIVPAVNMPLKDVKSLEPYIEIAEKLGRIYYQTEKNAVEKINIKYSGELADKDTRVLTLSLLKGFFETISTHKINYVNAELVAKNKGIEVLESKTSHLEKYTNLITATFVTKEKELSVSGTVFAKDSIRIVDFFGYTLDFEPTKYVLAIQNVDKPGIIGKIGTLLGNYNINIAAMQWSRKIKGEKAVSFVSIDTKINDDILNELRKIDGVLIASMVVF